MFKEHLKILILDKEAAQYRPYGAYIYDKHAPIINHMLCRNKILLYLHGKEAESVAGRLLQEYADLGGTADVAVIWITSPSIVRNVTPHYCILASNGNGHEVFHFHKIAKASKRS